MKLCITIKEYSQKKFEEEMDKGLSGYKVSSSGHVQAIENEFAYWWAILIRE